MINVAVGSKQRLDLAVTARGLCDTRSRARAMILAGDILVNGSAIVHAGSIVRESDRIEFKSRPRFVSRGGEKLDCAIEVFGINPAGQICADLGASTGGFTDCLLQRGAERVYAVDVGYGQLDAGLRVDARVVVIERTNARYLDALAEPVDLIVIDVSFISLSLILPVAAKLLRPGGRCVPLIKPQFEAGRKDVGKGGVVRDPAIHRRVLHEVAHYAWANRFLVAGLVRSPLLGPSGNFEFLADLRTADASDDLPALDELIARVLDTA